MIIGNIALVLTRVVVNTNRKAERCNFWKGKTRLITPNKALCLIPNFEQDHIQGTAMYSEETALMVIFIFVVITYGSIIVWGYFFKTIVAVMYIFDETLSNKFYDLLLLLSTDPGDGSSDEVDLSFSWFLPDKWHHQIGILSLTATVVFILVFKLLRMLANGAIWLIKWRCSKNRLRNGAITTVS